MGVTSYDFRGRTAVIAGGSQGIGLAVVHRMAAAGARIAVLDRVPMHATQPVDCEQLETIEVDITHATEVEAAVKRIAERFGRVDMLVNSAGIAGPNAPLWQYNIDDWRRVVEIDLIGTFLTCRACVPEMMKGGWGRIVNIASIAGKEGNPNASAYSAAKAGVIGMTKSLGKELAGTAIRVNAITPTAVRTAIFDQMKEEHIQMMLSKIPLGRFGTVDEIASICMWLCSDECSFSTGAVFDISGGRAVY
jgi:Dehydrogenases with different specificities (related to short-chain alcohol dehydrogenases)